MNYHTLLTHESPDLDAILSVLIMKRFGEDKYPGVSTASVRFTSANHMPDNKTPAELEQEGILCLDIGGGRFDTHPVEGMVDAEKQESCAAELVAKDLGVIFDEDWAPFIEYARLQDTTGHSLKSKDYVHHLVSIHTILLGLDILHQGDSQAKLETGMDIIEHIPAYFPHRDKQFNYRELLLQLVDRYMLEHPPTEDIPKKAYQNFNKWYKRLDIKPKDAFSTVNVLDDIVSLKAIAIGAFYRFDKDREKVYQVVSTCLDAIIKREERWALALQEFEEKAIIKRLGKAFVTAIASPNGMVIKAARYRNKGDLIIYRDSSSGATSILRKQKGPLAHMPLEELAAKVRLAECVEREERPQYDQLEALGMVHGWFLHQSGNMLIKGSPKATDFEPSKISLEHLNKIAYYQLMSEHFSMPSRYSAAYMQYRMEVLQSKFEQ